MEWIKLTDKYPKELEAVIICLHDNKMYRTITVYNHKKEPYWIVGWGEVCFAMEKVKCWMPDKFPAPPDF